MGPRPRGGVGGRTQTERNTLLSPKPDAVEPKRVREVTCEACGTRLQIDFTKGNVSSMRELASTPAPGRVTIRVGDVVVHQCADGTFGEPQNVTER